MKKFLAIISAITLLVLPAISFASNYIAIPDAFIADVMEYASQLFTDINLLIVLAIGLPLGFWIIRKVIALARVRA